MCWRSTISIRRCTRAGSALTYLDAAVELLVGDVRDHEAVGRALKGIDAVYHFAAAVGVGQSMYEIERYTSVNAIGAAVVLEEVVERRDAIRKLVVASSMSIYGEGQYRNPRTGEAGIAPGIRPESQLAAKQWELSADDGGPLEPEPTAETKPLHPTSVYAVNKRDHEELFLSVGAAYGIPAVALRFFNVYGERQALSNPYTGVAAIFSSRLLNDHRPVVFEDGRQTRDFIDVSRPRARLRAPPGHGRRRRQHPEPRHGTRDVDRRGGAHDCRRAGQGDRARGRRAVPRRRHPALLRRPAAGSGAARIPFGDRVRGRDAGLARLARRAGGGGRSGRRPRGTRGARPRALSSTADVSVSLVNTNSRELLLACLESLPGGAAGARSAGRAAPASPAALPADSTDVEIVVLDNASEDGSAAAVRERFPGVRLIEQRHRAGFGANHNTVIRATTGRYVFVLNEDTTSEDWGFERMVAHLDANPRVAALGPRLVYPDGRPQSSAWRFPSPETAALGLLTLGRAGILQSGGAETRDVDWAMAAALLLRREALDEVGLFDEEFFIYSEETDLARRLRSAGWRDAVLPAGHRRAPRVAVQRGNPGAADQRDVARPPPLLAQAPLRSRRRDRGGPDGRAVRRARPAPGARPRFRRPDAAARARCDPGAAGPASASWRRTGTASTRATRRPRLRQISPHAANLEPRCSYSLQTTTVRCARRSSVRCSCTATRSRSRPTGTRRWPPSSRALPTLSSST